MMRPSIPLFIAICTIIALITTGAYYLSQQPDIQYYKGHNFFSKGDYPNAIQTHEKNLQKNPSRSDVMRELAQSYQWSKNYTKAIEIFRRILQAAPKDLEAKDALAETLSWNKEFPEAIRLYREVLAEKDNTQTRINLAEAYLWSEDYKSSQALLRDVLKNDPKNTRAKFILGKTMQYAGRPEEAVALFQDLLDNSAGSLDKDQPSGKP